MNHSKHLCVIACIISIISFSYGQSHEELFTSHFDFPIESVLWAPDGASYITTNGSSLLFWDTKTNQIKETKKDSESSILTTKLSPDGICLVTIYDDNSFIVQDIVTKKFFTKQNGLSDVPILDAAFLDDFYTLLLPMDGKNIYNFFCLLMTNEAIYKPDIKSESYVYGLDIDKTGTKLLVTYSDGNIKLIDIETKEVLQETKSHSIVSITSEFTPDNKGFLYQVDENTVRIQSLEDDSGVVLTDYDKPINTAAFTPNGKSLAMADKNGFVKVYNVEKGYVEDALKLNPGDIAFSCSFSPDGQSLLIGTKDGNVIVWKPNFAAQGGAPLVVPVQTSKDPEQIIVIEDDGKEHPDTKRVVDDPDSQVEGIKIVEKRPTDEETDDKITIAPTNPLSRLFKKNIQLNPHNIFATVGFGSINSKNFLGNAKAEVGYLNYKIFPFYWGASLGFDIGFTSKDFPYHYHVGTQDIGAPLLFGFAPAAIGGFHYLFEKPDILAFAELAIGVNIRMLASSSVQYPIVGTPATSFFSDLAIGAQWKMLRAEFDLQLDTNFIWAVSGAIGVVFKIPSKSGPISNPQGGKN